MYQEEEKQDWTPQLIATLSVMVQNKISNGEFQELTETHLLDQLQDDEAAFVKALKTELGYDEAYNQIEQSIEHIRRKGGLVGESHRILEEDLKRELEVDGTNRFATIVIHGNVGVLCYAGLSREAYRFNVVTKTFKGHVRLYKKLETAYRTLHEIGFDDIAVIRGVE